MCTERSRFGTPKKDSAFSGLCITCQARFRLHFGQTVCYSDSERDSARNHQLLLLLLSLSVLSKRPKKWGPSSGLSWPRSETSLSRVHISTKSAQLASPSYYNHDHHHRLKLLSNSHSPPIPLPSDSHQDGVERRSPPQGGQHRCLCVLHIR